MHFPHRAMDLQLSERRLLRLSKVISSQPNVLRLFIRCNRRVVEICSAASFTALLPRHPTPFSPISPLAHVSSSFSSLLLISHPHPDPYPPISSPSTSRIHPQLHSFLPGLLNPLLSRIHRSLPFRLLHHFLLSFRICAKTTNESARIPQ